jgi:uncharacterized protein DUF4288
MADSPESARWYIAELIEELILDGNVRNVVHRKTQVIFADCLADAYEKALSLSREHEIGYLNQSHKLAQTRYWGLNELNLLHDANEPTQPARRCPAPQYRASDHLTPVQIALLMSMQSHALPN